MFGLVMRRAPQIQKSTYLRYVDLAQTPLLRIVADLSHNKLCDILIRAYVRMWICCGLSIFFAESLYNWLQICCRHSISTPGYAVQQIDDKSN